MQRVFTIYATELRDELTTFTVIMDATEGLSDVSTRP